MDLAKFGGTIAALGATLVALPLGFGALPIAMAAGLGVKEILDSIGRSRSRREATRDDNYVTSNGPLSADEILKMMNAYKTPIPSYRNSFLNDQSIENNDTDLGILSPNYRSPIRSQFNNSDFLVQNQPRERQRVRIVRIPTERRTMPRRNTVRAVRRPRIQIDEYGQIFEDE